MDEVMRHIPIFSATKRKSLCPLSDESLCIFVCFLNFSLNWEGKS